MKSMLFFLLLLILMTGSVAAKQFTWAGPQLKVQSDIPANWASEEKTSEFGSTLFIRAPGDYAYIALIYFSEQGFTKEQLSNLSLMEEWTSYAHLQGGSKLESKTDLSAEKLKKFNAGRGKSIKYSWVNANGDKGHTSTFLLMVGSRSYEYQLYCTDEVFAKEGKKLTGFLDSIRLQ